jgi:hypothetical protein
MPIIATVIAVSAAMGLMVSIAEKEVVTNAVKVKEKTIIATAPIAKFLWIIL